MLTLNVLTELRQHLGSVNEYEIDEPYLLVDDQRIENITGSLRLLRTDRGLLAKVEAEGATDERCSRCDKELRLPVHLDFEEEFVPILDPNTSAMVYLPADDETFRIDKRYELDLREGLRQYILISEPVKPLCKPDCAGLCPICGADLNEGPHQCEEPPDERWSALAGLKREIEEGD